MVIKTRQNISILGCGWLGYPLAKRLMNAGYIVRGSTTSKDKLEKLFNDNIIPHHIIVSDKLEGDVDAFFNCDVLFVNIPPGRTNPEVESNHPDQIKSILKHAQTNNVAHVIFISSTGVYKNTQQLTDEDGILEPSRPTGRALVKAEQLVQSYSNNCTILRMAGLVGEDRQPGKWFVGKRDMPNGDTPVNMVHRDDCISAIEKVIEQQPISDIYNICADLHPIKKIFYQKQSAKIGLETPRFLDGVGPHKIIDNRKFKVEYGFDYDYPDPCLF